jgi:OFA family oxalate/formate antiporter-like MFS transporter
MCTDLFGPKYATTNLSMLYTAKGAAAFLVPLGSLAAAATGNWNDVLYLTTGINVAAVILVLLVLRPAANRHHAEDTVAAPVAKTS